MRFVTDLVQSDLKKVLIYMPETGEFFWIRTKKKAGWEHKSGYWQIKLGKTTYKSHRLAWLHMTGKWPEEQIDHKNRIKNDNRWCNF